MKKDLDCYEELLEESVCTIAALRLKIQKLLAVASDLENQVRVLSAVPVILDPFDDSMEWCEEDYEDGVYRCPQCGAPGNPNGRCGMPCI